MDSVYYTLTEKRDALITQLYASPLLLNRLIEAQFLTYNENRR